jgi:hypothetical protein
MYEYDKDYDYGENSGLTRNIALIAVSGLAAYGLYRLFSNPDMVRRLGPVGDRIADGVNEVKNRAGDMAGNVRQKAGEYAGRAKEKYQQWREGAGTEAQAPASTGGSEI